MQSLQEIANILAKGKGEEREQAVLQLLLDHAKRASMAAKLAGQKTVLEHFCLKEGVPLDIAQVTLSEMCRLKKPRWLANTAVAKNSSAFELSREDAERLAAEALHEFPRMAAAVRRASQEGRISYQKSPNPFLHAHQFVISEYHVNELPCDIAALLPQHKGKPYASAPNNADKLGVGRTFTVVHECSHLATCSLYQDANGVGAYYHDSMSAAETYSLFGEQLGRNHLLRYHADSPSTYEQVEHAYAARLRNNLAASANCAAREIGLHDAYAKIKAATTDNERKYAGHLFVDAAKSIMDAGDEARIITDLFPLKALCYPLGGVAAEAIASQIRCGVRGMHARLEQTAEMPLGYADMLDHLGIDKDPKTLVRGAISHLADVQDDLRAIMQITQISQRMPKRTAQSAGEHNIAFTTGADTHIGRYTVGPNVVYRNGVHHIG